MILLWTSVTVLQSRQRSIESVYHRCNSRCRLDDCLGRRVVEVLWQPPVQPPIEGDADVGVGQPEFDVVRLVRHRVLDAFQPAADRHKWPVGTHLSVVRVDNADETEGVLEWHNRRDSGREIYHGFDNVIRR